MTSIYTYPILIIIAAAYYIWRRHVAINAYGLVAVDIDKYLGEDHPEQLKDLIYHGLDHSLKGYVPLLAILFYIRSLFSKKETAIQLLFKQHGEAEVKPVLKLLVKTILVNMTLSPISYLVYFVVILLSLFLKFIFNLANNPKRLFKNIKNNCESSLLTAVG